MLRLRILLLVSFCLGFVGSYAQVVDDFSDGDFTNNPTWAGDNTEWEVLSGRLHLNGNTAGGVSHLATPSTAIGNTTWEFNYWLDFNPSGTNYVEAYLASNMQNLEGAVNGYLVRIGNTTDEISLYYVNGGTKTEILDGIDGRTNVALPKGKVRVVRDNAGLWQLYSDTSGTGNNFVLEGSVTHSNVTTSTHFGFSTLYTSTRFQWCYFDSINVTAAPVVDTVPPVILSATATSATTVQLAWSENLDLATAQTAGNYLLNGTLSPVSATIVAGDSSKVDLDFSGNPFGVCATESLMVANVEDRASNVMLPDTATFNYTVFGTAAFKSIIINEIMADPTTPSPACVPAFEYIEIYNRSNFAVDLQGWTISDNGAPRVITNSSYPLCPGEYVLLVGSAANFTAYSNVIGVTSFPSLNNAGDFLGLRSNTGVLIDTVDYDISWYQDNVKEQGGWSLELINPSDTCATASNWIASNDACGGTPSAQNSVYSNVPDITAPQIASVTVTGPNTLQVCYDEPFDAGTASIAANFSVNNGIGAASSASPVGTANTCVDLVFAQNFNTAVSYTLSSTGVSDCKGNNGPSSGNFLLAGPTAFKSIIFNEIFPDPDTTATNMPLAEFVEIYNRTADPFDLAGWKFRDATSSATLGSYTLQPNSYLILCANADTALFTGLPYLGLSTLPSLNNTGDKLGLRDAAGILVDTLEYPPVWYNDPQKENGGWTIELINPDDTCGGAANWMASIDPNGGTPGAQNSVYSNVLDVTPPAISSVVVTGANSVTVCFNETVTQASAALAANYVANNGLGTAVSALPQGSPITCIDLTFATAIDTGTLYTLTVTNVEDCNSNSALDTGDFMLTGPAPFRAIVINEIFPDPDTTITTQPNAEYIELYNRSGMAWNIGGWKYSDTGSPKTLGSHTLNPGDYLILCPNADTAKFSGKPYLGLSSWPSLNNSGDQLGLRDGFGTLIDTVGYDLSTYQDNTKEDGGWSLELINPEDTCSLLGNWIASNDPSGGTPGLQNSVYDNTPDQTAPTLVSAQASSSTTVDLCFDETMDLGLLTNPANYSLDNGIGSPNTVVVTGAANACVTLSFASSLNIGTIYTLSINNMADCKGNAAAPLTAQVVLGGNAQPFQVVVNEIFADESPVVGNLPEAEFIELHNNGPNVVSLANWTITDRRDTGTLPNFNLFPGAQVVLCASSDVSSFQSLGVDAIAVSGFPGWNNSGDSLELYDQTGTLMDFAYYDLTWYHDEAKEDGGWSIERKDPSFACTNADNWAASTDANGATPGRPNSIAAAFIDQTPPAVLGVLVTSRSTVRITFSEQMDFVSLLAPANYVMDNGIGQATAVNVNGQYPYSVDVAFGALMDTNQVYCLSVSDVTDCPGNPILLPNSTCFGIAEPVEAGDIVLNEILFNPYTGGSDFVELYNLSDKILDLSTIYVGEVYPGTDSIFNAKRISTAPLILFPKGYICLTADRQNQISTYLPPDTANIFEMTSFPSYDDSEGECVIYTDSGLVLDRLAYLDDWSFPDLDDKNGVSLERLDFNRATQDQNNWHSAASTVRYATPGYKNSQILIPDGTADLWLQPETFSPDQDGFDDVLSINYIFREPDWNIRIGIFDNKGRIVRMLLENTLVGTEQGTIIWDGTTDGLHRADIGIYVVLLEAVNPTTGATKTFKVGCVLATRF